ncbi:MAG: type II toxin-antitoxin system VapC family toxin [Rhabdochlamydiaceae bacterium]|nr:type II toxin-antitoxin system VapC family toxin [Rhabdochlamydiaceae bacterium]
MPIVKNLKHHKIILDTHIWLWVMTGDSKIKASFRKALDFALQSNGVLISPISIWEVGMLVEKQRISLDMDCQDWIEQALDMPGIKLVPISPRIAIQSSRLPGTVHGDPADRLLIATAHQENAVLVTCDKKLIAYGQDRFINVHDPM